MAKDIKINGEGRKLVEFIIEREWVILNGGVEEDREELWTYTGGRENSIIDYALGDKDSREEVERLEIGENVQSDHHPVIVWI